MKKSSDIKKQLDLFNQNPQVQRAILALDMPKVRTPSGIDTTVVDQKGNRDGDCYKLSASFVLGMRGKANRDWTLVHGIINPPIGPQQDTDYHHAWCEKGNILYEPVLNYFCKKSDYYKAFEPKDMKKYKEPEARRALLKHETWGVWR